MGMGFIPTGSLQAIYRERSGRREENVPFQGSLERVVFLLGAGLCSLRSRILKEE
jgi:hypothetical protein